MASQHTAVVSCLLACLVGLSVQVDLKTMIAESSQVMVNGTEEDHVQVLKKFFFTEVKGESIWPLIYNATISTASYEYGFEELVNIERDTHRLAKHLKFCREINTKLEKANCLVSTIELVKQIVDDTTWPYDDDIVMESISKQIHFYVGVRSMLAHALSIVEKNLNAIPNAPKRKSEYERVRDFYKTVLRDITGTRYKETSMPMLKKTSEYAEYWRKDQVTAVEICQQRTVMWKDFSQGCEIRWRRERDGAVEKRAVQERKKRANDSEEESEEQKQNHILKNNEIMVEIQKKVDAIGGTLHDTERVLTATVVDSVTGQAIYKDRDQTTMTNHRGDIMEEFVTKGNNKRDAYVKSLMKGMSKNFGYIDMFTDAVSNKLDLLY